MEKFAEKSFVRTLPFKQKRYYPHDSINHILHRLGEDCTIEKARKHMAVIPGLGGTEGPIDIAIDGKRLSSMPNVGKASIMDVIATFEKAEFPLPVHKSVTPKSLFAKLLHPSDSRYTKDSLVKDFLGANDKAGGFIRSRLGTDCTIEDALDHMKIVHAPGLSRRVDITVDGDRFSSVSYLESEDIKRVLRAFANTGFPLEHSSSVNHDTTRFREAEQQRAASPNKRDLSRG